MNKKQWEDSITAMDSKIVANKERIELTEKTGGACLDDINTWNDLYTTAELLRIERKNLDCAGYGNQSSSYAR